MSEVPTTPEPANDLARRAADGDDDAWHALVEAHRSRLRRIVAMRLDPRLSGVVDPSDVIQETFAELHQRLPKYVAEPSLPFFVWLRCLAADTLSRTHRRHLGVQARDASRVFHAGQFGAGMPEASSVVLSDMLTAKDSEAIHDAIRSERRARVASALDELSVEDREVLVLRHFEGLNAGEAALVLDITESAARKRYLRALERFTQLLQGLPGGLGGFIS